MKSVLPLGGIVLVLGAIAVYNNFFLSPTSYTSSEGKNAPLTVEKEVLVDSIEKRVQDAQEAQKSTVEAKAQAEYQAVYDMEMAKIKAEVLRAVEDELAAQRKEVEQTITAY